MSGGQLESLLLGSDNDSSDGEDDNKRSAPPAPAPVAPPVAAPAPAVPAPAPPAARAAPSGAAAGAPASSGSDPSTPGMDPSEISRRLKSLYSPASRNRPTSSAPSPSAPSLNPPAPPIAAASAPIPSGAQRGASYQQQPQQQAPALRRSSSGGVAPSSAFSSPSSGGVGRSPGTPQHGSTRLPTAGAGPSSQLPASAPAPTGMDPFEPTPLHDIIERNSHHPQGRSSGTATTAPQTSGSGRLNTTPISSLSRGGSASVAAPSAVASNPFSGQPTSAGSSSGYAQQMVGRSSSTGSAAAAGHSRRSPGATSSTSGSANPHAAPGSRMPAGQPPSSASAAAAAENKRKKEQFLTFTRVLMKYVEQKDRAVHRRATEVIKECAEKHRSGDPNYSSLTSSMQFHLRRVVGDVYWRKAEEYLRHILKRQQRAPQSDASGSATAPGGGSVPGGAAMPVAPGVIRATSASAAPPAPAAAPVAAADQDPIAKLKNDARIAAGLPPIPPSQPLQHQPPPGNTGPVPTPVPPRVPSSSSAPPQPPQVSNPTVATPPSTTSTQPVTSGSGTIGITSEQIERAKRDREMVDMRRAAAEQHSRQQHEKAKQQAQAAKKVPRAVEKKKVPAAKPEAVPSSHSPAAAAPVGSTPLTTTPSTTQTKGVPAVAPGGKKVKSAERRRSSSVGTTKTTPTPGKTPGTPTPVVPGAVDPTAAVASATVAAGSVVPAGTSVLSAAAMITALPKAEPPPKEYAVLMEEVDHALKYDWTNSNMLLSPDFKMDVNLDQEQRMLLYGSSTMGGPSGRRSSSGSPSQAWGGKSPPSPRYSISGAASPRSSAVARRRRSSVVGDDAAAQARLSGWGKRNVVSVRTAWSLLRLPEFEALKEKGSATIEVAGEVLPKIPGVSVTVQGSSHSAASNSSDVSKIAWTNEETAEYDDTLTLLSEAAEVYVKSILEGAVASARQRQNLDGIRLWHQQHLPKAPPLSLRLGCDVRRQVSLGAGNAAKTVQRMEEALERDRDGAAEVCNGRVDDETLRSVTSMSELSLRPILARGVSRSEHDAKRSFEIYGGKDSGGPPLGRVPKKAKIIVRDFDASMNLPSFPFARKGATML